MTDKVKNRKQTVEKHKSMICKVFEVKIQSNCMSKFQKEQLNTLFREAKWFKNYCLSYDDIYEVDDTVTEVDVVKDKGLISEPLTLLSSQMKQGLLKEYLTSCKTMSTNKKKGNSDKNGKFKFKSVCNEIPLKQLNNTYYIDFSKNRIEIQKIKGSFYVNGLEQITKLSSDYYVDICNAQLLRKASGFYLHIICYIEPKKSKLNIKTGNAVGIDFGIQHNLTTSDGEIIDCKLPETKGIKLASRRLNKYISKSKKSGKTLKEIQNTSKYWKLRNALRKSYEKLSNIKNDFVNKTVHNILSINDLVVIQDELIHNWHSGLFGKEVQYSCMGAIKAELKKSSKVLIIESSFPSTQFCPVCGQKTVHSLDKREYKCSHCGYEHPNRDVKSAETLLNEGISRLNNFQVSPEQRAQSLGQRKSSTENRKVESKKVAKPSKEKPRRSYALA